MFYFLCCFFTTQATQNKPNFAFLARLLCFNIMSIQFFYFMEIVKETKWTIYIAKYLCFNYNTGSIIYKIKILKQNHYMWN